MRRVDAWTHALAGLPGTGSRDVVADRDGRMKGRLLAWTPVAAGRPDTEAREVVAASGEPFSAILRSVAYIAPIAPLPPPLYIVLYSHHYSLCSAL